MRGKVPELWQPDTGRIREQIVYDVVEGRTMVPLRLAPYGSVFVVFRDLPSQERVVSILRNGDPIFPGGKAKPRSLPSVSVVAAKGGTAGVHAFEPGRYELTGSEGNAWRFDVESVPRAWEIPGSWEVRFPKGWGAPESTVFESLKSWTKDSDPGVKYFSGTALYRKEFDVPASLIEGKVSLFLDLGRVKNFAEVTFNGAALGILWKPPFRVDISDRLEAGNNLLEVEVTNLWPNRLIGDDFLPEEERHTRTNVTKFNKDSLLLESGLLGPVRILGARVMEFDRALIRE